MELFYFTLFLFYIIFYLLLLNCLFNLLAVMHIAITSPTMTVDISEYLCTFQNIRESCRAAVIVHFNPAGLRAEKQIQRKWDRLNLPAVCDFKESEREDTNTVCLPHFGGWLDLRFRNRTLFATAPTLLLNRQRKTPESGYLKTCDTENAN